MNQPSNRSICRRYTGLLAILVVSVASCAGSPAEPEPFDLNTLLVPINEVVVYAGTQSRFAEVGDTKAIDASGFHNGEGFGTQIVKTATWTTSDPTMLQVVRRSISGSGSSAVLRGGRPGLVTLSVTLNGVTGVDTIRVIPKIGQLHLRSTRSMLAIGDTVEVWFRADDLRGDSIPDLRPLIVHTTGPYPLPLQFVGP